MKKLKLNWGTGIAATYILFVVGTLVMVVIFMNQEVSLETENYYTKGIQYQDHIDKVKRTNELPEQLKIGREQDGVKFTFPAVFTSKELGGTIYFYRPSKNTKDFYVAVSADSANIQKISDDIIDRGLWKIKVEWTGRGVAYYNEKLLMVN